MGELSQNKDRLLGEVEVVFYCSDAECPRAEEAARLFVDVTGYTRKVYIMKEGMAVWQVKYATEVER